MTLEVAARVICTRGECRVRRDASCCHACPEEAGAWNCEAQCVWWADVLNHCPWQARETAG